MSLQRQEKKRLAKQRSYRKNESSDAREKISQLTKI